MTDVMRHTGQEGSEMSRHLHVVSEPESIISSAETAGDFFYNWGTLEEYAEKFAPAVGAIFDRHPELRDVTPAQLVREHQQAVSELPTSDVRVVKRKSMGKPEKTPIGTFAEELVYFSDGSIRTVTHGTPNERRFGRDGVSPYPIDGGDALGTGPSGFNRDTIKGFVEEGYHVEWLHHEGRHAVRPTGLRNAVRFVRSLRKSITQSAHHHHAHLDDMADHGAPYSTQTIFRAGDSRSSMAGEVVDALAPQYVMAENWATIPRRVGYSDYTATCFEHPPEASDLGELIKILPREGKALGKLGIDMSVDAAKTGDFERPIEYLGTLDLHPMNMVHELAWIWPLMRGGSGHRAQAVPLDSIGTRTLMTRDIMSQHPSWQITHSIRPGIEFIFPEGAHIDLVRQQQARADRFGRLLQEMHKHNFELSAVNFSFVRNGMQHEQPKIA